MERFLYLDTSPLSDALLAAFSENEGSKIKFVVANVQVFIDLMKFENPRSVKKLNMSRPDFSDTRQHLYIITIDVNQ